MLDFEKAAAFVDGALVPLHEAKISLPEAGQIAQVIERRQTNYLSWHLEILKWLQWVHAES